ncbi:MAG: efflux RND transporter periplasmic adaptor subunit [Proteobacteria bacterium]|nr:efflux RND transporter periplasmic adaptor subunit [Pseudomonadota bacterium]
MQAHRAHRRTAARRWFCALSLPAMCAAAGVQAWGAAADGTQAGAARGVLRAQHEAVLSSNISERILRVPFREGQHFDKGAVLVAFDCARYASELKAARAGAAVEARNAQVQSELLLMDATGKADADIARLKEKERRAQAEALAQRMSGCNVVAPFSGSVVETMARVNETPPPNEKLLKIVSDGPLELHMVVPSKWLSWLQRGSELSFTVDETGDTLRAKVLLISGAVDAVSQTVKVVATVQKAPASVLAGMSGRAVLDGAPSATRKPN